MDGWMDGWMDATQRMQQMDECDECNGRIGGRIRSDECDQPGDKDGGPQHQIDEARPPADRSVTARLPFRLWWVSSWSKSSTKSSSSRVIISKVIKVMGHAPRRESGEPNQQITRHGGGGARFVVAAVAAAGSIFRGIARGCLGMCG